MELQQFVVVIAIISQQKRATLILGQSRIRVALENKRNPLSKQGVEDFTALSDFGIARIGG